ncbi:uncharacterized protein BDW47DRAFT_106645 [Aspergillus candidus]|uniref:Uncharacterized protein n=1 Tax=Aspergillus candidus TaxID=41067 RepID=A0A2I2FAP4_ASPCN|nr:hypothetical protein BDW47DRAFT_106645 [Aspergillus candidus]PLB37697.1 hypothetical protein BDW47DRAFT_106645 [Aspergillus candidus]
MKFSIALALTALQATTVLSSQVLTRKGKGFEGCATKPFGCGENGWCWNQCADAGEWCWTAYEHGKGDWKTCKEDAECDPSRDSSVSCAMGDCDTCGCSCT